jgi:hypothetical protein
MLKIAHMDPCCNPYWSPHVVRFSHPFKDWPVFAKYLQKDAKSIQYDIHRQTREERLKQIQDEINGEHLNVMAAYYFAIYNYFRVKNDGFEFPGHQYAYGKKKLISTKFNEIFKVENFSWRNMFACYDDGWIENILTEKPQDQYAARIQQEVSNLEKLHK